MRDHTGSWTLIWAMSLALTLNACGSDQPDAGADTGAGEELDAGRDTGSQDTGEGRPDLGRDLGREREDLGSPDMGRDQGSTDEDMGNGGEEDMGVVDPDAFELVSIVPPTGPVEGGTRVRLTGAGLIEGTKVFFGSALMEVDPTGSGLIGDTPAALGSGPVTVKAIHPDGRLLTLPDGFTYTNGVRIDSVSPARVPTRGGVEVELRGEGFSSEMAVSFGGDPALRVSVLDDASARALAPARAVGVVDVRVTTRQGSALAQDAIEYFEELSIGALDPATGRTSGGETITLSVDGVTSDATVTIGGALAEVVSVDPNADTITVRTPAGSAGPADVIVTSDGQADLATDAFYYREDDATRILAVSPGSGPDAGGVEVRVLGNGLDAPGATILFEGVQATILESSATWARVRTPAGALGPADVTLEAGGSELARLDDGYVYESTIWIDTLSPTRGDVAGGDEVTLTGEGLLGAERVIVGGVAASFTVDSETQLRFTTPAHGAGLVDVVVERGEVTGRLVDAFTYTEPLEIWGFSPVRGAISGGTHVTVRGRGFFGSLSATLDGVDATRIRRLDRNNLTLRTPPNGVGEADLEVTSDAGTARAPYSFEYYNPASRFGGASGASIDGAVNVSVFDVTGAPIEGAFVMLSTRPDTRYQGLTDVNGQITLSGADVLGAQTVTATAAGFSSTLIQAVDAEDVTIFLNPTEPPPPNPGGGGGQDPPPFGTIRGTVTTPGKLSDPANQRTYDMVVVRTTQPNIFSGNPDPGPGSVVIGEGSYEIFTRIGDLAVVAMCGVYDEVTDSFVPQYMGVERFLFVSDRGEYDVDIDCDIPLDQSMSVKLINPIYNPQGPNNNRVRAFWDFGFEGIYPSPTEGNGLNSLLTLASQPEFIDDLADVTVTLIGGSYTGLYEPLTQTGVEDVSDLSATIELGPLLDVPEPIRPLPDGVVVDNEIRWQADGPYYPDVTFLVLSNEIGLPVWTAIVPGTQTYVQLPEFPDFSALPAAARPDPYAPQRLFMRVTSVRVDDFDFDSFTYEDLNTDRWTVFARRRWSVRFE